MEQIRIYSEGFSQLLKSSKMESFAIIVRSLIFVGVKGTLIIII